MTRTHGITHRRPRRGQVLAIGDSALDEARRVLTRPPLQAVNLFDAIGELTVAPVGDPITAVLVSAAVARSVTGRAVAALRRVDPSIVVVLIADEREALDDLAADGFDECLVTPIDGDALARLIDAEVRSNAGDTPSGEPLETTGETSAETTTLERPDGAALEEQIACEGADAARRETLRALGEIPSPPAAAPTGELGDTDLVEAALHDPRGLLQRALELARQQSGWDDMTFTDDDGPPPDGDPSCAEVRYGDRRFGELRSLDAGVEQLRPWAEWLGRWLALDRSYREFRLLSYRDDLTGAWNRRFFNAFLAESIDLANRRREPVTVMVFDIDDFKRYNDEYGHEAGDVILIETVRLLNSVIRQGDRVCRIGGDEFAVIFADTEGPRELGSRHPENVEQMAKRFQDQICTMRFPKLGIDAPGRLSISGGLATYPWDGTDPESLIRHADKLALQSKRSGKNVITFGPE